MDIKSLFVEIFHIGQGVGLMDCGVFTTSMAKKSVLNHCFQTNRSKCMSNWHMEVSINHDSAVSSGGYILCVGVSPTAMSALLL